MQKTIRHSGFPGGTGVENPPASARDAGSSPGLGGSHMLRSNWAHAPQLLILGSGGFEPQLLKPTFLEPVLQGGRGHHNEKPTRSNGDPTQP